MCFYAQLVKSHIDWTLKYLRSNITYGKYATVVNWWLNTTSSILMILISSMGRREESMQDEERKREKKKYCYFSSGAIDVKLLNLVTHESLPICMTH